MKTMINQVALAVMLGCVSLPAAAAYKCKAANGYVYQDRPCIAQGPSEKVMAPAPVTEVLTDAPQETETAARLRREKQYLADRQIEKRRANLQYEIGLSGNRMARAQQQMEIELAQLRQRKTLANNNLAGATWEQSISTEMQAVTQKYNMQIEMEQQHINRLNKELEAM